MIVVTTESQVYTWGDGIEGQLGHGDMDSRSKPELVKTLAGKSITRYREFNYIMYGYIPCQSVLDARIALKN